ncbi:glycosyltransferase family 2 protein [Siminovitchia acidinfaciens]|uniref:Glycosyltransferase family 2 protein n=1 Tax=Siminovitchia acidinfaciens TaxID=2321395 RepID=A0A429XW29_9BACI|nr:glycosyltransferase family 2 protein [Siminovitchia acidinfaciens]RST72564.1 glycosyltransferase family 2 protein [Siminovitchia acidinfaciens]
MSKVSVVVPIYNAGKRLHRCIKSILKQTFRDFELILVNDGSTDDSLSNCKRYSNLDKRIRVMDKENEGSIMTRKRGVEASRSPYIMFVDADDWIDCRMIEILYNESIVNSVDITVCNMYKVFGDILTVKKKNANEYFNGNKLYNEHEIKKNLITAYFHGHSFPSSLCAKLYKKEYLINCGQYLDRINFLGDDLFLNLEIFLKAKSVKVIDKPLYYYRLGGFTNKYMPHLFEDMVNGFQIQKEVIEEHYQKTKDNHYNGICIMLLNTFKTCLYNLFESDLGKSEIKDLIRIYVANSSVKESLHNKGSTEYFTKEYLNAIKNKDIDYLYQIGRHMYFRKKPKKTLNNIMSKL